MSRDVELVQIKQTPDDEPLVGEFFGTDFNFLYSTEMQETMIKNCLD